MDASDLRRRYRLDHSGKESSLPPVVSSFGQYLMNRLLTLSMLFESAESIFGFFAYFFFTSYHLNARGVEICSERLAELLSQTSAVQSVQRYWQKNARMQSISQVRVSNNTAYG
jgi:hypothetical protein